MFLLACGAETLCPTPAADVCLLSLWDVGRDRPLCISECGLQASGISITRSVSVRHVPRIPRLPTDQSEFWGWGAVIYLNMSCYDLRARTTWFAQILWCWDLKSPKDTMPELNDLHLENMVPWRLWEMVLIELIPSG